MGKLRKFRITGICIIVRKLRTVCIPYGSILPQAAVAAALSTNAYVPTDENTVALRPLMYASTSRFNDSDSPLPCK